MPLSTIFQLHVPVYRGGVTLSQKKTFVFSVPRKNGGASTMYCFPVVNDFNQGFLKLVLSTAR
jgi:hypothetical protein